MDNIPFSDTIFTGAGTTINRPLLLIEPPQRINGDDKAKLRTTPRSNEEQGTKNAAASEPKPVTVTDDTVQKSTAASEPKPATVTNETVQNNSDKQQQKKKSLGELRSMSSSMGDSPPGSLSNSPSKSQLEGSEKPPLAGTTSEQVEIAAPPPTVKNETERPAPSPSATRPVFESNIVLGVALEGSKRTLPIEEGIPPPVEENKMAASRSGKGSSPFTVKDKKGQTPTGDQSEQER